MFNSALTILLLVSLGTGIAAPHSIELGDYDVRNFLPNTSAAFPGALASGAGFSFKYGGQQVGPIMPADWTSDAATGSQVAMTQTTFRHLSGLVVVREVRVFKSQDAIEYRLVFRNTSDKPLPVLTDINALQIGFDPTMAEGNCVISSHGGEADTYFPPRNWTLHESCLMAARTSGISLMDLSTTGGRSSDKDMPLFFLHNGPKQEGVFVALGWSGQWHIASLVDGSDKTPLRLIGGVPDLEISLNPGEAISAPTVLIGFYKGSPLEGTNRMRRLIRDEYTPKLNGQAMLPVATFDALNFLWDGENASENMLKKSVAIAADVGQEYFLVDAGWYEGDDFNLSVGNWEKVNTKRLPNGLAYVADYVRSQGLKLGLWFELERVGAGTSIALQHPDWVLWDHGDATAPWYAHAPWLTNFRQPDPAQPEVFGLLDFGKPEVQQYVKGILDRYIREYGVKYIRYDFNVDPLPYWRANEAPGRRGMRQIRHIEGLYAVWDWVLKTHPDTIIENCASGGRRIDLETIRRSHTAWISDQWSDPTIVRHHLQGINRLLPGNYSYVYYVLPAVADPGSEKVNALDVQSRFGGAFGTGDMATPDRWTPIVKSELRHHVDIWKKLRRYLIEDYYPLGEEQPRRLESWSGWQFQDPADQSGFIQTFRTKTPDSKHRWLVKGLQYGARYRFEDAYSRQSFEVLGKAAMTEGIELTQEPMSSRVLTYKKVSKQ